jgi:hypothetical protein
MDRDRDTGQYLSCHHERRHKSKLAFSKGLLSAQQIKPGNGQRSRLAQPLCVVRGRMVSDFTLTSQRENIAGLEVVLARTLVCDGETVETTD